MSGRLSASAADADDLVQDAFLHALRAADQFTPGTNLKAWLRAIVRNLANNHRRSRSRSRVKVDERQVTHAAATFASTEASPEQLLLDRAIAPSLQHVLEAMPKALRDAVWLRDVEGQTYAEMARQLRIPIGTVMSRISRGRRLLHDRLLAQDDAI